MGACDVCGEKKGNVTMFEAGVNRLTKGAEYFIRREVESITGNPISSPSPYLCSDCYKEYGFAEKLRNRKSHRW